MKYILLFILICTLIFVTSCDELKSGEVYEKEFKEAYTQLVIIPIMLYNGNSVTTIMIPYFFHYPDRWVIKIKQWNYTKGKYVTATYYVTEDVYNAHSIGDFYNFDPLTATLEEPVVKEKKEG